MMNQTEENTIKTEDKIIKFVLPIVAISIFLLVIYISFPEKKDTAIIASTQETIVINKIAEEIKKTPIEAQAIFIWDVYSQKEIYSQNKETQLPLASLSKVMTALVASNYENKNITVNIDEKNGNGGLKKNEKWNLKDLIDFTLISSSNGGANAVASAIQSFTKDENGNEIPFVKKMNEKAKELNLKQTYFLNESGLDIDESSLSGSYGSAQDVAMLFDYVVKNKPEILEATSYDKLGIKSEDNKIHNTENTNLVINDIPWVIGSKTGYTDLAGGNLTVVFDNGMMRPIIISVLGSTKEGRFEDMKKLVDVVLQYSNKSEE
ncbi:MAG: D-alanyl-D-alanine carboxypeptidase [Parcubacteria group bacterium Athens0714_16]|nr:MAG: D-alanyl-D-alanine carboxypeptidase [Parcubacteria group bacterium Athens0714_16]